ncbi:MAG: radical SAM protein [Candidatus Omnitrophica bacterium]|nr:radical SAM protein [Candidatus Omnitrophota bacterium]MDD5591908.1 radical SAM protein [Candidatus Omnitrophota bacterium]
MNIMFVQNGTEHLGIEALSSWLKKNNHKVDLAFDPGIFSGYAFLNNKRLASFFDPRIKKKVLQKIINDKPDIVAFSIFTGNYQWAVSIAKEIKKHFQTLVVFGGPHATACKEIVINNDCVDIVVVGEGEDALLEIANRWDKKDIPENIQNTVIKKDGKTIINPIRPYIKDLDSYPFFDKQLFYDKVPQWEEAYLTMTSRGCTYNCAYCTNSMFQSVYNFEKMHVRRRSVENVIEELKVFKKRGIAKKIFFGDDVFIFNKDGWFEKFAERYKREINIPYWCCVHALSVKPDIVRLLKESGCLMVTMGIQSGSGRIRNDILERKESLEKIIEVSELIKKYGILLSVDNIFGSPTETPQDMLESLKLYLRIKPDRINSFWLTYFPRTKIIDYALSSKEITESEIRKIENGEVGFISMSYRGMVKKNVDDYFLCQILFNLITLNQKLAERAIPRMALLKKMPGKEFINAVFILLNVIKIRDFKFFNLFKYIFSKKKVP